MNIKLKVLNEIKRQREREELEAELKLRQALESKDFWYTAWKRPIENRIKRKITKEKK